MTFGNTLLVALVAEIGLIFAIPTNANHAFAIGLLGLTLATYVTMLICLFRGRA